MIDGNEVKTLKYCLDNTFEVHGINHIDKVWYASQDTMLSVATILDGEDIFPRTQDVIRFFEKPWKWESDMQEIINDYVEMGIGYAGNY